MLCYPIQSRTSHETLKCSSTPTVKLSSWTIISHIIASIELICRVLAIWRKVIITAYMLNNTNNGKKDIMIKVWALS